MNAQTGKIYSLASDPCVELGPHVGYNRKAHEMTVQAVKEFLASRFKSKQ